ncbi:MAG: hypothetical protein ABDH28_07725 [Brevinematia bacterium]
MTVLRFLLVIVVLSVFTANTSGIEILDVKVHISLPKNQMLYSVSLLPSERYVVVLFDREVREFKVNGLRANYKVTTVDELLAYSVELPKVDKIELEIACEYNLVKECKMKGIVVLSEMMKTLPYIRNDSLARTKEVVTTTTVELSALEEIDLVFDGKKLSASNGNLITFQRRQNLPLVLGYLDLFSMTLANMRVSIVLPKGNEGVSLEILSLINLSLNAFTSKFDFRFPKELKIIYSPKSKFSERIGDTIVLNEIKQVVDNYFSNLEKLENFIVISHELLHSAVKGSVDDNLVEIFEGLVQYLSIKLLSEVFLSPSVEDRVYDNYLSQMRYYSFAKEAKEAWFIARYIKYPLVFRYISSVVGEISLISLFKYLSSLDREISLDVFKEAFRNITGVSFDAFLPLFDGVPTLWNLKISVSGRNINVSSTAPTRITTTLKIISSGTETNISIDIPRDSSSTLVFDGKVDNVVVNPLRDFPELFYHDNYLTMTTTPVVTEFLSEFLYIINTGDFSKHRSKKIMFSRHSQEKLSRYISQKVKVFGSDKLELSVENMVRHNGWIVIEFILHSALTFRQGFVVLSYDKSYYVSDLSILM